MRILLFILGAALACGQPAAKIRVAGSVVALNGEAVRKATVRLRGQAPVNLTAATDDDGKFAFEDVAPGQYTLTAEKAGFVPLRYGARSNNAAGMPLILTAGQELKDLSLQMTPQGIISGRVSEVDGDAAPNVLVSLQRYVYVRGRRQLSSMAAAQTNDQGDFRIAGLAPGRYYAYARDGRALTTSQSRAAAQEINVMTYYPNALDPAGATALDLPAGGEMRGVDIQLRRGQVFAIRGKTLDPSSGKSPGGFPVELTSKDAVSGASSRAITGSRAADGGFEFRNLAAGSYVLRAMPGTVQGVPSSYTGRTEVTLANSSMEGVVLPLTQGFEISGTVTLEGGDLKKLVGPTPAPAPSGVTGTRASIAALSVAIANGDRVGGRLSVQLSESTGVALSLPTQAVKDDGTFRYQGLGAGTYMLEVSGLPEGTYIKSVKFGGQDVTRSALELRGGGSLAIVLSSKAGSVSGTVRDNKGQAMGGYLVMMWPKIADARSLSGGINTAVTDQTGAFKFPSVGPADYYVAAFEDLETGLAQSGEFLARFDGDAATVKVVESGQASVNAKVIPRDRTAAEIAKLP